MKMNVLATLAVAATALFGASAHAGYVLIDDFSKGDQFINQNGTNTNAYRTLTSDVVSSVPPVQSTAEVDYGSLTVTNGSGDSSKVTVGWNLGAGTLAAGSSSLQFLFNVLESDANPTSAQFYLDGKLISSDAIPGNTSNRQYGVSIDGSLWDNTQAHKLEIVLNGAPGWDLQLDAFGLGYADPKPSTVPEPGSLALVGLGLVGAYTSRRRFNSSRGK